MRCIIRFQLIFVIIFFTGLFMPVKLSCAPSADIKHFKYPDGYISFLYLDSIGTETFRYGITDDPIELYTSIYLPGDSTDFPENTHKKLRIVYCMTMKQQLDNALSRCNEIMKKFRAAPETYDKEYFLYFSGLLYANIYISKKKFPKAWRALKEVEANLPYHYHLAYEETLIRYYYNKGDIPKALNTIDEVLRYTPGNIPLLLYKAKIFEETGDLKKANRYIKEICNTQDSLIYEYGKLLARNNDKNNPEKEGSQKDILHSIILLLILLSFFIIIPYIHQKVSKSGISHETKKIPSPKTNILTSKENEISNEEILFKRIEKIVKEKELFRIPSYTIDDLSLELCTNRSYISRSINNCTGKNFNQWINQLRIEDVLSRLSNLENISLKNVASDAGFASLSTFNRAFTTQTGTSPRKYIENIKSEK